MEPPRSAPVRLPLRKNRQGKEEDYCGKGRKEDVLKAHWMPSMPV